MIYKKKDFYHQKAKEDGYLARSAYKLKELQKKFSLFKKGNRILDLGCAPGAWVQVASEFAGNNGSIIGVDIEKVTLKLTNFTFYHMDAFEFLKDEKQWGIFDLVLSDMAPKTSGVKFKDQVLSAELCLLALTIAEKVLKPGGSIVVKLFEGEDSDKVVHKFKEKFQTTKFFRPQSTRQSSKEIYLIGTNKKAL
ncbi:MAG: RlmE family RNA methyltransferase [Oligoflexia bacterium]|nr:RlmE family RNA methyltransferase [Oligoflexia bacterium]